MKDVHHECSNDAPLCFILKPSSAKTRQASSTALSNSGSAVSVKSNETTGTNIEKQPAKEKKGLVFMCRQFFLVILSCPSVSLSVHVSRSGTVSRAHAEIV